MKEHEIKINIIECKEFIKIAIVKDLIVSSIKNGCKESSTLIDKDVYWMITNEEVDRIIVEIRLIPKDSKLQSLNMTK